MLEDHLRQRTSEGRSERADNVMGVSGNALHLPSATQVAPWPACVPGILCHLHSGATVLEGSSQSHKCHVSLLRATNSLCLTCRRASDDTFALQVFVG